MQIQELMPLLKIQDYTFIITIVGIIITSLIEYFSSKFSPWSWVFSKLGKAINKETLNKLNDIYDRVEKLEQDNVRQDKERELDNAYASRRRILSFADEIRLNLPKSRSQESYDEILREISSYKDYCDKHPSFENDKAVISISIIEQEYKETYKQNNFV